MQNSESTRYQEICTTVDTTLDKVLQDLTQASTGYHELCQTDLQHIKLIICEIPDTEDRFLKLLHDTCNRIFRGFCYTVSSLLTQMDILSPCAKLMRKKDYPPEQMEEYENSVLSLWVDQCEKYSLLIDWLSDVFSRLNTVLILRQQLPSLEKVAHKIFLHCIYKNYNSSIVDIISKQLTEERQNQTDKKLGPKKLLIKHTIFTFIELAGDFYKKDVEDRLIEDLNVYYNEQASAWKKEEGCTFVQYIFKVECSIIAELDRVSYYLDPSSETEFINALNLLSEQSHEYWLQKEDNGCLSLFQDDKAEDLARLGRVTKGMSVAILDIAKWFQKHITAKGHALVQEAEEAASSEMFLLKLGALHAGYGGYCSKYFYNHRFISKEYNDALKGLCNKEIVGVKFSDILVDYCDYMLKKENTMNMTNEAASEFYKVVDLSQFIVDHHQLFITSYGWRFYERLLYKMSNLDNERLVIERLGQVFGANLKRKMEDQLNDIASCKAPLDVTNMVNGIGLTVKVLDYDIWEKLHVSGLTLADRDMADCVAVIEKFYNRLDQVTVHQNLSLVYSEGRCCLKTEFENIIVELVMCPYQAALLMLFNDNETLAYGRKKELLNISDSLLTSLLLSMSSNGCKILRKEPSDKPLSETDYFMVNSNFTPTSSSIKVPPPSPTSTVEVSKSFCVDELNHSIIRVLKKRQAPSFIQLFHLCVEEFGGHFQLDELDFSRRVEDLVREKYMELKEGTYTLAP